VLRAAALPRAAEVTAVLPEPRAAEAPRAAESACEAHASGATLQAQRGAQGSHLHATQGDQDGKEDGDALLAHRAHRARSHAGSGLQSSGAGQEEARAGMAKK
jgi:hypothetical protein